MADSRVSCDLCGRKFNSDRLDKHYEICKRQKEKKRDTFDSSKQRQVLDENGQPDTKVASKLPPKTTTKKIVAKPNRNTSLVASKTLSTAVQNGSSQSENSDSKPLTKSVPTNGFKDESSSTSVNDGSGDDDVIVNGTKAFDRVSSTNHGNGTHHTQSEALERQTRNPKTHAAVVARPVVIQRKKPLSKVSTSAAAAAVVSKDKTPGLKAPNGYMQCPVCQRSFNRAAAERHIPWCQQKQRSAHSRSSNANTEEALARFRARNGYQPLRQKAKGKSVGDLSQINDMDSTVRRSLSLNRLKPDDGNPRSTIKRTAGSQRNNQKSYGYASNAGSKSSSASSFKNSTSLMAGKGFRGPNAKTATSYKSQGQGSLNGRKSPTVNAAQSKVKLRLQQEQQQQRQRQTALNPKTPIMKFKEKFPHHSHQTRLQLAESEQLTQLMRRKSASEQLRAGFPKTVPGVRTGGMSPTRDARLLSGGSDHIPGHHSLNGGLGSGGKRGLPTESLTELEMLRARIKEMYLSGHPDSYAMGGGFGSSAVLNDNLSLSEGVFSRESSAKLRSLSRSVSDFLASGHPGGGEPKNPLSTSMSSLAAAGLDFTDGASEGGAVGQSVCPQCNARYLVSSAKYCHECGARRHPLSLHALV